MAYNITATTTYFYLASDDLSEQIATNAPITVSMQSPHIRIAWDQGEVNVLPADIDEINAVALSPKSLANAFAVINAIID